jgi:uncharacterized membrane protein
MGERAGRVLRHLRERTRRRFITGLLVIVPLWMTWFVLSAIVRRVDRVLAVLPKAYHPDAWLPFPVPGLGVILTLVVIQLVGVLGANLLGRSFVRSFEGFLARIPFVRGLYSSTQQVLRQIVAVDSASFRRVVLVRYPGGVGLYRVAFVTGEREVTCDGRSEKLLHLFLPNSPNAATGHFFFAEERLIVESDMTTEQAFKLLMSGGILESDGIEQRRSETA